MNWERLLHITGNLGMVLVILAGIHGATTFIVPDTPVTVLCFYLVLILMMMGRLVRFIDDLTDAIKSGGKK